LRGALADGDRRSLVHLLSALGLFWTVRGEHVRLIALAAAVADALRDWQPPPDLADQTRAAVMITLSNSLMTGAATGGRLYAVLRRLGRDAGEKAYLSGLVRVLLAFDPADTDADAFVGRMERLADDQDRHTALSASQWLSYLRENAGDAAGAITAAKRTLALSRDEDGPWSAAMPHTMLAQLTMHVGDRAAAVEHARAALPVMRRLGASDDEGQLRSLLALCAIADGRLADAEDEVSRIERMSELTSGFGGGAIRLVCRAELALASGDHAAGLRIHREAAAQMRAMRIPGVALTGLEPWVLFGDSVALSAHARYATGADEEQGRSLFLTCRDSAVRLFAAPAPQLDFPAAGQLLFALGDWALVREPVLDGPASDKQVTAEVALRLLALADRFGYNRTMPTMMWERIVPAAEEAAPGRIGEFLAQYRDSQPACLLTEAGRLAQRLPG